MDHAIEELNARGGAQPRSKALAWVTVAFVFYALLISPFLILYGPAWFLHLGREFEPALDLARDKLGDDVVVPHVIGHDGKSFWVLARDPLLTEGKALAHLLDRPTFRAQRIAYPLLASPWYLGGETMLLWGLIASNLIAVAVGTWTSIYLVRDLGAPARASLAFILSPAVVVSVLFDLSDALLLTALLSTLLFWLRREGRKACAAATVAVLAKEVAILLLIPVALFARRMPIRDRLFLVAIPGLTGVLWNLYARWQFGLSTDPSESFAAPFSAYVRLVEEGIAANAWMSIAAGLLLVPLGILIIARWVWRRTILMSASLGIGLLIPFLSLAILDVPLNSLRTVGPGITLLIMDFYASGERRSGASGRDAVMSRQS